MMLLNPFGLSADEWVKVLDKGLMFAVSLLALMAAGRLAWVKINDYESMLRLKRKKLYAGDERDVKLHEHRFFTAMDFYLNTRIPILPIREPGRAKIFRDFLEFKFTVVRDMMLDIVKNNDISRMPQMQFEPLLMDFLNDSMEAYEQKAREEGIPDIVLEKFALWHRASVEQTSNFLLRVSQSPWYGSNIQKMVAVLDYLTTVMHSTLLDAQFTLSRLNGELDGLVYKGVTVQPYKHYHHDDQDSGTHPGIMVQEDISVPPLCPMESHVPTLPPCHDCERRKVWEQETKRGHHKV